MADTLLRISVGIEDANDLCTDLSFGLERAPAAVGSDRMIPAQARLSGRGKPERSVERSYSGRRCCSMYCFTTVSGVPPHDAAK